MCLVLHKILTKNTLFSEINKQVSAVTSQAPKAVASHLAMMQYCADVRIDEIWRALYESLLLVQDHLPPNPYPILVSHLRTANIRWGMRMFIDSGSDLFIFTY